jgi:kanamycin kinase
VESSPVPPPALAELLPGWSIALAYSQFPRLTTWRLSDGEGRVRYAKVDIEGGYPTLEGEAERMVWAAAYLPVPTVLAVERAPGCTILITEGLPGRAATDPVWRNDLSGLVRAYGQGLAAFHGAVGEEWCPFRFHNEAALEHIERRAQAGVITAAFEHEFSGMTEDAALAEVRATVPASEDLVVCHGDYCPPNTLLSRGRVTGYVDLGELGVADRWRDIAIGGWSTGWNFGVEFEPLFYESYGVEPDPARIRFYRLLWSLSS